MNPPIETPAKPRLRRKLLLDPAEEPLRGGAALVFDVQVHCPVTLLLAVLRHKRVLLPVGKSKKTSPPRKADGWHGRWRLAVSRCEGREPVDEHVADAIGELRAERLKGV